MKNDTSKKEQARKEQPKVVKTLNKIFRGISWFLKLAIKFALKLAFDEFMEIADAFHEGKGGEAGPLDNYYLEGITF